MRRRFTRNHNYVAEINAHWQADLADIQSIAMNNGGIKYLIIMIDVFSKFACEIPVHSKDAKASTMFLGRCSQPRTLTQPSAPTPTKARSS